MTIASLCPLPHRAMCSIAAGRSSTTPHGHVHRQVLGRPVLVGRRRRRPSCAACADGVAVQRHAGVGAAPPAAAAGTRDVAVHQQRLRGVADADPVGLGVEHDRLGHRRVGGGVHVDVAVADAGLDHRHGRLARPPRWISPAPPRGMTTSTSPRAFSSSPTDAAVGRQQLARSPPAGPAFVHRLGEDGDQRGVGAERRRRAAQQRRVAALQAEPGGVDRHVRAGLVDDADHAERHPHLAQLQPVGQPRAADDVADRVGQGDELAQRGGDPGDAGRRRAAAGRAPTPACRRRAAASTSAALAASTSSVRSTSASAMAASAASLASVGRVRSTRAAARARSAAAPISGRSAASDTLARVRGARRRPDPPSTDRPRSGVRIGDLAQPLESRAQLRGGLGSRGARSTPPRPPPRPSGRARRPPARARPSAPAGRVHRSGRERRRT